jgi:hypothetical protein
MTERTHRAVLTLAMGQPIYIRMAANLARSFIHWHEHSDICFALATDKPGYLPTDVRRAVDVIQVEKDTYGKGFSPKLHLDKLAPAEETLFVDADCLIAGSLEQVFQRFDGHEVSVVGKFIEEGDWFGDVAMLCRRFDLDALPLFVGAVYYLRKGSTCDDIFRTARKLESRYDEIGLVPLRGMPNEEPLMSIAMALHNQTPLPDNGKIKADAMNYPSGIDVDILEGTMTFKNYTGQFRGTACELEEVNPIIGHFNDTFAECDPYTYETARLRKSLADGWPLWAAGAYAKVRHSLPEYVLRSTKNTLRPVYRRIFGTREVKPSARIPA